MTLARLALVSLALAAGLVAALRRDRTGEPPLSLAVAASLRPVAEAVAADFAERTGRRIEIRSGGSEQLLMQLGREPCDVFLPADDDYVARARNSGLVGESRRVATLRAVVVARAPLDWPALTGGRSRVALARPETAAIGLKTRLALTRSGRWSELNRVVTASPETVTACLTAVTIGAADAAVVWDVVARAQPRLVTSELPELAGVTSVVTVAACRDSADPEAARAFIDFLLTEGRPHFARAGFTTE